MHTGRSAFSNIWHLQTLWFLVQVFLRLHAYIIMLLIAWKLVLQPETYINISTGNIYCSCQSRVFGRCGLHKDRFVIYAAADKTGTCAIHAYVYLTYATRVFVYAHFAAAQQFWTRSVFYAQSQAHGTTRHRENSSWWHRNVSLIVGGVNRCVIFGNQD